jgi:DNA-binding transcriptional MerR regulator
MPYSNELVAFKLRKWEKYLNNYQLPQWEDIPDLGLYMEQIIDLLKQYLDYLPPELKEEQFITASTIHNYVRTKVMPQPRKKKYYREHIAYLIMILTLKQSLSIALIQKLIPMGLTPEEVRRIYTSYADHHRAAARFFMQQIQLAAAPILNLPKTSEISAENSEDLIAFTAITGGFTRLLAEKLLLLDDADPAETDEKDAAAAGESAQ